jgi:hypothetical protein
MVELKELPNIIAVVGFAIILASAMVLAIGAFRGGIGETTGYSISNETISSASSTSNDTLVRISVGNLSGLILSNASEAGAVISIDNYAIEPVEVLNVDKETAFIFRLKNTTADSKWEGADLNLSYSGSGHNDRNAILNNGTVSIGNITEQMPVAGTIVGVSLIIVLVAGLFIIFGRKKKPMF